MGNRKPTAKAIILRKKLAVAPIGALPFLAFLLSAAGGGSGTVPASAYGAAGFDVSVPKSETTNIAGTKREAYEETERSSYMSGFNADIVPEMETQKETEPVWREEPKDDFDGHGSLAALYQKHGSELENRRKAVRESTARVDAVPDREQEVPVVIVEEATVTDVGQQVRPRRPLFHDNRSSPEYGMPTEFAKKEIKAVIHGDQEIGGSRTRVKMRTTASATINGIAVPANTIVYANASILGNRLSLMVDNIGIAGGTHAMSLTVYDATDGNPGLNLSSGIANEEKTRAGSEAIGRSGTLLAGTGIVGAVVTGTGNAIGNIFSKSAQNSSIRLVSNHQVILKP